MLGFLKVMRLTVSGTSRLRCNFSQALMLALASLDISLSARVNMAAFFDITESVVSQQLKKQLQQTVR